MKKIITVIVILLISFHSFAQITYEPGYFVNNQGTKTDCLIKNIAWYNNPTNFEYKLNENGAVENAKIGDVQEFAVGSGYHFKRFETNIDQSSNDSDKLSDQKAPEWKKETVFLKLLVQGYVTLYQYQNSNLVRYFISSGSHQSVEQLVYKQFISPENPANILTNNYFKQQLFLVLKSPELKESDFDKLEYKKESLIKIFLKSSNNTDTKIENLDANQNKSVVNFKITAGANQVKMNYTEYDNAIQYETTGSSFRFGAEIELILAFNQRKWALFLDPNFQTFSDAGRVGNLVIETQYGLLQIPAGLRHYIFINQSKLFLNAGFSLNFPINATFQTGTFSRPIERSTSFFGGVGFRYHNFGIEARVNLKHGVLANYDRYNGQYSSVGLIGSYKFL